MTTEEKLKELGYKYSEVNGCYIKETTVRSEKTTIVYRFLRSIGLTNNRPLAFTVELYYALFADMDTINEYYELLRNEYYDTKKEFESLKNLESGDKELLNDFAKELLNSDNVDYKDYKTYKAILKKLEVLATLKKRLDTCDISLKIKDNALSANEFNKIKEWLEK